MKIQSVSNYQQQNSTINFNGKLIVPDNISELTKKFVDTCGERINKILEPAPCDMFVHEIPVTKNTNKIMLVYHRESEPGFITKIVLNDIIEEFNNRTALSELKLEFNRLMTMPEDISVKAEKPVKQKPYVPLKIGKPQKGYVKNKFYKK